MKDGEIGRRVCIVLTETGGAEFAVQIEGVKPGLKFSELRKPDGSPNEDLRPADYWGMHAFKIVTDAFTCAGALLDVYKRS